MLSILSFLLFLIPHTYYVSICELNYDTQDEALQVSWRLFADDLEWAVTPEGDEYFYIGHPNYNSDDLLEAYFEQRFFLIINETRTSPTYIGHEFQGEEVFCYFEVPNYNPSAETEVYIDVLTELYSEQQHYVHYQSDGQLIKTSLLSKSVPSTKLELE